MKQYSAEETKQIELASFYLYYNSYSWPEELNKISHELITRIGNEGPNTVMEAGIVTALNFFISQRFQISVNNIFPDQPNDNVPPNWRNNIWPILNQNIEIARFYVRKRDQTFGIRFTYDGDFHQVSVAAIHTAVKHRPFVVYLREEHLTALTDPEHAYPYALHVSKECVDTWNDLATKSELNRAPTALKTPGNL